MTPTLTAEQQAAFDADTVDRLAFVFAKSFHESNPKATEEIASWSYWGGNDTKDRCIAAMTVALHSVNQNEAMQGRLRPLQMPRCEVCGFYTLLICDCDGDPTLSRHSDGPTRQLASDALGKWMSAALDDPAVCDAMKADIQAWFNAGSPAHAAASAVAPGLFAENAKKGDAPGLDREAVARELAASRVYHGYNEETRKRLADQQLYSARRAVDFVADRLAMLPPPTGWEATLAEALEPFADAAAECDGSPDSYILWEHPAMTTVDVGHLRKAAQVLTAHRAATGLGGKG